MNSANTLFQNSYEALNDKSMRFGLQNHISILQPEIGSGMFALLSVTHGVCLTELSPVSLAGFAELNNKRTITSLYSIDKNFGFFESGINTILEGISKTSLLIFVKLSIQRFEIDLVHLFIQTQKLIRRLCTRVHGTLWRFGIFLHKHFVSNQEDEILHKQMFEPLWNK